MQLSNTPWQPQKLDLSLAVVIALLFPILAGLLYGSLGALLPMVLYYGLAWGVVIWRRGSSGYFNSWPKKITPYFYLNLGVILACLMCAYLARNTFPESTLAGILATALVWTPMNAASEQLLWIYLFESWDLYPQKTSWIFRSFGLVLFTLFVGMIHTQFWAKFLDPADPASLVGTLFVILTSVSGYLHLVVWRKSNQMLLTFIPHFLLNLAPILWTHYSILPHLLK